MAALQRAGWVSRKLGLSRRTLEALAVESAGPVAGRIRVRRLGRGRHRYYVARDVLALAGEMESPTG